MPPPRTPDRVRRGPLASPFGRVAILWAFLVAMFIGLWQLFSARAPEGAEAPRAAAPSQGDFWVTVLAQWGPLLVLGAVFGAFYLRFRSFAAANKRAVDLLAQGDAAAAGEAFRRLARGWLAPRAVARFNLGLALLRLGDVRGARDAFAALEGSRAKGLLPTSAALVALCDAVLGDVDAADQWAAEARRRAASPSATTRVHLAAEAVVRLRRGDAAGAARLFDETWGEIERCTSADLVRALRIVRALAADAAGRTGAGELLAGARPFRPGEYAWIAAGWPEMRRYLAEHGFEAAA